MSEIRPDLQGVRTSGRIQLISLLVVGCLLLPFYRFELGADGISYLSIAEQYCHGYWREAINAYWGPLYSWLLVPLLLIHIPGMLATRIISLAAAILALWAAAHLTARMPLRPVLQNTFLWLAALVLLGCVVLANTPDLLFSALLLCYVAIIFRPEYPKPRYAGIVCGVLGAFSFFAKSYGFAFFLFHFCLFSALAWATQKNRLVRVRIIQQFVFGICCFGVFSALWIVVLHSKTGTWMLSSTGEYNHRLVGPKSSGYPHLRELMAPPTQHSLTVWQGPLASTLPPWNPWGSGLPHELKLIENNTKQVLYFWGRESIFFPLFLICYIALCLGLPTLRWEWIYPVFTIALFTGGYILLTVQDRYFWFAELLLLLVAFRCLELVFERTNWGPNLRLAVTAILVLSFAVSPLRALRGHFRSEAGLYASAELIRSNGGLKGPFASCDNWAQSAYVAFVVHQPYFGVVVPEPDADEIARDLNPDFNASQQHPSPTLGAARRALASAHIKDLLVWPDCPINANLLGPVVANTGNMQVIRVAE